MTSGDADESYGHIYELADHIQNWINKEVPFQNFHKECLSTQGIGIPPSISLVLAEALRSSIARFQLYL